jgi:hypothetical protein
MDDYADIYYVDTRNATTDHRTGSHGSGGFRPSAPPPSRTVYVPPTRVAVPYANPAPWVAQAPYPQQSLAASFFGKLTSGQVVEMVAQLFAAIQPLPAAPNATREANTDSANMILYQSALAQHAKRDEQVRTLGGLIAKLVG